MTRNEAQPGGDAFAPNYVFAVPIWTRRVVGHEAVNREIMALLPALMREDGIKRSNEGGWHSQSAMHHDERLAGIRRVIGNACAQCAASIGFDFSRFNLSFQEMWLNANGPGHTNKAHLHPGSFLSGAYYVAVPEGSGNIEFHDPVHARVMATYPGRDASGHAAQILQHTSRAGDLVIFPGWLQHSVQRNESDALRVTVSFNMTPTPATPDP